MKNQKGITLVALIITVIVMVIIAAAAISIVWNQTNLIDRVEDSVDAYKNAAEKTHDQLNELENQLNKYFEANPVPAE